MLNAWEKDSSVNSTGDYFAVDNVLLKSGEITWNTPVTVENAEYTFSGLTPETDYCVRVQGVCDGVESAWSETVSFTTGEDTSVTQTIALSSGWSWWSTNLDITLNDLKAALVAAMPGVTSITIKSQSQNIVYNGTRWIGTLTSFDVSKMYEIYAPAACTITLSGTPVSPAEHPVTIVANGSTWIGYPLSESKSLNDAFGSFPVAGDIIKAKTGNSTYNGSRWIGTLTTLQPGQGYIYKSASGENRSFSFDNNK